MLLIVATVQFGCASSYRVPGRAAELSAFGVDQNAREQLTDSSIQRHLTRQPLATFPAAVAVARVQAPGYRSYAYDSYGKGRYSVVTTREEELDAPLKRLQKLPMMTGIAPVGRLLLPEELQSDRELRNAAAQLHAELLLIYTLDTTFHTSDVDSPLDLVTLGFIPSRTAHVNCTASGVLMDTRNGYIYGVVESSTKQSQAANAWTTDAATDAARKRAEAEAIDKLVGEFETMWSAVVNTYGGNRPAGGQYGTGG